MALRSQWIAGKRKQSESKWSFSVGFAFSFEHVQQVVWIIANQNCSNFSENSIDSPGPSPGPSPGRRDTFCVIKRRTRAHARCVWQLFSQGCWCASVSIFALSQALETPFTAKQIHWSQQCMSPAALVQLLFAHTLILLSFCGLI